MTKKEFLNKMERAKYFLIDEYGFVGCCNALEKAFNGNMYMKYSNPNNIVSLFNDIFYSNATIDIDKDWYWLGHLNYENYQTRLDFLEAFQNYVIINQFYEVY